MPTQAQMIEATRLTREGRLAEATALLQGGAAPRRGPASIDMVPPSAATGGAWTMPQAPLRRSEVPEALRGLAARVGGLAPAAGVAVPEGARFEERLFDGEGGARPFKLYRPSTFAPGMPLVVMLHGCAQSPDDFAAGTRMNGVAEERGLVVAYPAQVPGANAQRCWNWFSPADQVRGRGEPAILAGIARAAMAEAGTDPGRTFVAGLSAGGAQAAIMGMAYPDLFAAAGVHSGLACGAARDVGGAFAAMRQGGTGAPGDGGVPTIVFHGDRDGTVHPANADAVAEQALGREGGRAEVTRGRSAGGQGFTRTVTRDARGRAVLEQWVLHGAGHAWAGGSAAGSYTDPAGVDASREMVRFFLEHRLG